MTNNPWLSIIVPAYNEENRVETTLKSLLRFFDDAFRGNYEVLVIMDGCTDGTPQIVSRIVRENGHMIPLVFNQRLGKGGAVTAAIKLCRGDVLIMADADGSTPPESLHKLATLAQQYDLVIGSRYSRDSNVLVRESFTRLLISRAFNVLSRIMFWKLKVIKDTQCGAKAIRKEVSEKIMQDLFVTDFAFDVNLIYSTLHHGFTVKEAGITWTHEMWGSKISGKIIRVAITMLASIIRLRIYYSRFRRILNTKLVEKMVGTICEVLQT